MPKKVCLLLYHKLFFHCIEFEKYCIIDAIDQ